jgi:hypothetical protein
MPQVDSHPATAVAVAKAISEAPPVVSGISPKPVRQSNGLKEFLWQVDGISRGHLLDMGPVRQSTITFFIERGFKVYTEDLLSTWKQFLDDEEQLGKSLSMDADRSSLTPEDRAKRFLDTTMLYPDNTFDAVLMWDILDYLDSDLVGKLVARLTSLVRDGGVVLSLFHSRKPILFHRYRVADSQSLELINASCPFKAQRVFQNREIEDLFRRYRSSKMFVGRDQLREGLFIK